MNYDKLREELKRDEGCKLVAYKDSLGYWTIGVGHLLGESPSMARITQAECDALLMGDIAEAEKLARELVPAFDFLTDERQRALVNMAFNRGNHLRHSTKILPAILHASMTGSDGDWRKVKEAIAGSQWAAQVGKRADRLAAMFAGEASLGGAADPEST